MKTTWGARSSPGGIILASWGQIERIVSRSDVVLFVLDARDPLNTFSPKLIKLVNRHGRRILLVLNKCDLIPRRIAEEWKSYFENKGYPTVYVAAARRMGTIKLRTAIKHVAPSLPAVASVVGYPKVGKSSIINALKGKHSASTSPYPGNPGYTKTFQFYRVDENLLMIDTPGILPAEGDPLEKVLRGYPPEKLDDPVNPAIMLIQRILKYNPRAFLDAYGIESKEPLRILEEVAIHRGWFYKKTKEPLIEEAARAIIRDYHDGKLTYYIKPSQVNFELGVSNDKSKNSRVQ
ncbi:MAG: GTPase [Desulfurococcaceae archaeon]